MPDQETTAGEQPGIFAISQPTVTITEGDKVIYVLGSGRSIGQCRPAFVVRAWGNSLGANLMVLTDCTNDYAYGENGSLGTMWATSVPYSKEHKPFTWHLPGE